MSKIEDESISRRCDAMQNIILKNFTREAKWLYYQINIVEYLKDKGIDLVCDYEQKIKYLQSKLAEKDKQIDIVSRDNNLYKYNIDEQKRIIDDFTKQLQEKDKEIESLNHKLNVKKPCLIRNYKDMLEQLKQEIDNLNAKITQMEEQDMFFHNQLAISELEKVKVDLRAKLHLFESGYLRHFVAWRDICDQINKQIKELKGE